MSPAVYYINIACMAKQFFTQLYAYNLNLKAIIYFYDFIKNSRGE